MRAVLPEVNLIQTNLVHVAETEEVCPLMV